MNVRDLLKKNCQNEVSQCTNEELYYALLKTAKQVSDKRAKEYREQKGKKLYYVSAEFLIGKLLSNNLINLGIYSEVKEMLEENQKDIAEIEAIEPEPSLGNGGLGRLAACFLDSAATLGLLADGIGIAYHCGLFRQVFKDKRQTEQPNTWIEDRSWLNATDVSYEVCFGKTEVTAKMYDIDVVGYEGRINKLHLFDIDTVDESIIGEGISFDKTDIKKNLTLFLYPDDSDEKGKILRIYQQYFMVSAGASLILDECVKSGADLHHLYDYAVIQINDTHPSMIIPELIRQLVNKGIYIDEAIDIVKKTCAYTNHTILAEALEKWNIGYLRTVVPQLVPIIEILDDKIRRKYENEKIQIIDRNDTVHMAHMDIHYCFSVNGVASLHTHILKENELVDFYKIYPEKFNNKTNGITFRRWLMHANPRLCEYISELIGDGWKKDALKLKELLKFENDTDVLEKLLDIKQYNKKRLCEYLKRTQGIEISPDSIFDIQAKRLHEYKRQQLNALWVIDKYMKIKESESPITPITVIFGAKAAPAYTIAKDIIHLILCLGELIGQDKDVSPYLKVVMLENYNVSVAEWLIPACDISEQISLASKEASGTGNMKFMLNGAVTLGTEDGANVEIHRLVGDNNIYIFGDSSETVTKRYAEGSYRARDYYESDKRLGAVLDFIVSDKMLKIGNKECLTRLYGELVGKDWFMTFPDFEDYCKTKERAISDYGDRTKRAKRMLANIANAGYFSSDRTVGEYNRDIWKL